MPLPYRVLRMILIVLFRLSARFEVRGIENVPSHGPLIVAVNHIHALDSLAVMVALPVFVNVLMARKWERHIYGAFLRAAGAIFVTRGDVDRQALRKSLAVLESGGILGVAPEGTRSPTYQLQPARGGIAYLAHRSQAPILPVAVTGVQHVFPSLRRLRRAQVQVTVGHPFQLPVYERQPRASDFLAHADMVMGRIAALLPREYCGVYVNCRRPLRDTPAPHG